jgi:hypothetical protein
MYITHSRIKFHSPSSNGSLFITVKPKAKNSVRGCNLLVYILQDHRGFQDLLPRSERK